MNAVRDWPSSSTIPRRTESLRVRAVLSAPFFGGLASDLYPDAKVSVVADASGAYPSNPVINATISSLWGAFSVVPDWPVNDGITPQEWGVPEMFIQAGLHDPDIRFARFDNAFDSTQLSFAQLAGRREHMDLIRETKRNRGCERCREAFCTGEDHTILGRDECIPGSRRVAFVDWLTSISPTPHRRRVLRRLRPPAVTPRLLGSL